MKRKRQTGIGGRIVAGASWVSVLLLAASALSPYVSPALLGVATLAGLVFPFVLVGTLVIALLALVFAPRQAWITLLGLVLCGGAVRTFFPINLTSPPPKGALKVITWNTHCWGGWKTADNDSRQLNRAALYVAQQNPDIFCVQEGIADDDYYAKRVIPALKALPHHKIVKVGAEKLACFSRYPIVRSRQLCRQGNNGAAAFWLELGAGDTLLVVNCHLLSVGLNSNEVLGFQEVVKTPSDDSRPRKSVVRNVASKICHSAAQRAQMVDTVAQFLQENRHTSRLVMGDFNDSPISYSRHRISSGLKDAFVRTGNGLGHSYHLEDVAVRIDHMFCSPDWRPYACRYDDGIDLSDHYPLLSYFYRRK